MGPDARRWRDQSPRPGDTPRVGGGSIPRAFPRLGPRRWAWRARGVASSARSTTVTVPSPWAPGRARAILGSTCGGICPPQGPQTRPAWPQLACPPPTAGSARGTRWRWTWGRPGARGSRLGGALARTRGGGRSGCVAGSMAGVRALGWRCRAIPGAVTWRQPRRRPAGGAVARRRPGHASRRGVPPLTRAPGSGSTGATAPQGRWWSTWSNAGWWRGRRGGTKAPRNGEACYATATATSSRWCRSRLICPTPRLRPRGGSGPVGPQPHSASTHAASAARVKPGARPLRSVIGRGGILTKHGRSSPQGFW
jgi:hypothetical protein